MVTKSNNAKYPWDSWLKKHSWRILRGEEYHCQPHSMAQQIRNAAAKRFIHVSVRIEEDMITVTRQLRTGV